MFLITQGYGPLVPFTGTKVGVIPEYSSTGDTYLVTVNSAATPTVVVVFDQEITGLEKSTPQQ